MGNFEKHIPDYLRLIRKEIIDLENEQRGLLHDCNCDYCDIQDEVPDEDLPRYDKIDEIIAEREKLITALVRHAKLHGMEVEA